MLGMCHKNSIVLPSMELSTSSKAKIIAFVISSPLSSDGKTFIAILLALKASEIGKKVLLFR